MTIIFLCICKILRDNEALAELSEFKTLALTMTLLFSFKKKGKHF